ncbi:MAG: hypothetical protein J5494_07505, partial [Candidatus Methanomethylophilaceae archaeon]|nr:hypothetical protein [Candidatus Methanomethylophilaceae archaeon]
MRYALILIAVLAAVLAAVSVPGTDAEIIEGDYILAGDESFGPGTDLLIADGARLDVSSYNLYIGPSSRIIVAGSAEISCSGGSITIGSGTLAEIGGSLIPPFGEDVEYSFDGTVVSESRILSEGEVSLTFRPAGSDRALHASWDGHSLSVYDLKIVYRVSAGGLEESVGFTSLAFSEINSYEGKELNTRTVTVTSLDPDNAIKAAVSVRDKSFFVTDFSIAGIRSVTEYAGSNLTSVTEISGFGDIDVSAGDSLISVGSSVKSVKTGKYDGGSALSENTFRNVKWKADFDLGALASFLFSLVSSDHSVSDLGDAVKSIAIAAASAKLYDADKGTRNLSDLSLVYDRDAVYGLKAGWTEDGIACSVLAKGIALEYLAVGTDLSADIGVSAESIKTVYVSGGSAASAELEGVTAEADRLNLKNLFLIFSGMGSVDAGDILDNCRRMHLGISSFTCSGRETADIKDADILLLSEGSLGVLEMSFGYLSAEVPFRDGYLSADAGRIGITVSADGPLSEYIDAWIGGTELPEGSGV